MTGENDGDDILLSDAERLHALNVLSEHYAAGRLDVDEFYDRSGAVSAARTLNAIREPFRGLPGGLPLEQADRLVRQVQSSPAPVEESTPARGAEAELSSLRRRGKVVEAVDGVVFGVTLMAFLLLQFVVEWDFAWIVWPSLVVTLGLPRLILEFSDEDEEMYKELKKSDAESRKKRLRQASDRIRELENKRD